MIRILIGDDHPIVREGLKQILNDIADLSVTGEAADGQEILAQVRSQPFDLVMLDLNLPGMSGLEVLCRIKEVRPHLPVIVLSMQPEGQFGARVLRLGASGYLAKGGPTEEMERAIRKVVSGGVYVSATLAEKLATDLGKNTDLPPHERLSRREYEVMVGIASGKSPTVIAGELSLSVKTISTYRARALLNGSGHFHSGWVQVGRRDQQARVSGKPLGEENVLRGVLPPLTSDRPPGAVDSPGPKQ